MSQQNIVHPNRHGSARRTTFGYLTDDHPKLDRVQNGISAGCGLISAAAVVVIALVTLAEIVARSVFSSPLGWSVALVENILLPATAFFGIVTAYRSGAHVAVVSLFGRMDRTAKKLVIILCYVVLLAGFLSIAYPGLLSAVYAFDTHEGPVPGSSELLIPNWLWKAIVPISMSLGAVIVVIDLWREVTAPWSTLATDYDPGDPVENIVTEAHTALEPEQEISRKELHS